MSRRRNKVPQEPVEIHIDALSHEGRGIGEVDGKKVFIDGALPEERVIARYTKKRAKHSEAYAIDILKPSDQRIAAKCDYFEKCGGCSLQHLSTTDQLQHKQNVLIELLEHVGRVNPEEILAPLTGPAWQYRHKARLGVKYVLKKESLLVGFREKRSSFIVEMEHCEILHSSVGRRINALKNLIMSLDAFDKIPQIEVAVADNKTALVFRHLVDLNEDDINRLVEFQSDTDISIYLQSGGPTTVKSLNNSSNDELYYELDEYGIKIRFEPNDFTQINFDINKKMINRVIEKLEPDADDHILDLFCGLGNFSLPLAKKVGHVTAVEGDQSLVDRGNNNAKMNAIENINFVKCDLMADVLPTEISQKNYNKVLLDPPRTGCKEIIEKLDFSNISRLVYVSCNPSTLARDAGVLVHEKGLNLIAAGVMDMFPHTSHVESLAIFEH